MFKFAWFILWFGAVSVPLTYLSGLHALAMSGPVASTTQPVGARLRATHVLAADCPCSFAVAEHLVARGPRPGVAESVRLIVEGQPDADAIRLSERLAARGFPTQMLNAETAVAALGVGGAPWLLVTNDGGDALAYSGGYAPRRVASPDDARDLAIFDALARGERPGPHPSFGCAIGAAVRARIDPLGLKYR